MNNIGTVRRCVIAAALLFMCTAPARAQTLTAGGVDGAVRSARGNVLSDVLITVTDGRGRIAGTAFTDIEGGFSLDEIAPGEYRVRAERIGFIPREYVDVPVIPNRTVSLIVTLQPTQDPAPQLQSERFTAGVAGSGDPGHSEWVSRRMLRALPFMRSELDELSQLSTRSDVSLGFEGLPSSMASFMIDGLSFRSASLPQSFDSPAAGTAFTLAAMDGAFISSPATDVEWGGSAGSTLAAYTRRPGGAGGRSADLTGSTGIDGASYTHFKGAVGIDGTMSGDSTAFGITLAGRQGSLPLSAEWRPSPMADQLVALLRDREGIDVAGQLARGTIEDNALSGVARLRWRLGSRHSVESVIAAALLPEGSVAAAGPLGPRLESGSDAIAGAAVRSMINSRLTNNLRLSFSRSGRESLTDDVVPTLIVAEALNFGMPAARSAVETALQVSDALEFSAGRNTVKAGGELVWSSFEHTNRPDAAGQFVFANVAQLDAGTGAFDGTTGGEPEVSWSSPRIALFAQNRWTHPGGADVVVGFRAEQVSIRAGQVSADPELLTLTGVASNRTPEAAWQVSPRVAARWDLGNRHAWVVHGSAGVFHDRLDPALVSTWITDNGTALVHQLVGDVGSIDGAIPASARTARRVSLLDGQMRGPQSARVSAGVSRAIGTRGALELSAAYRDTRYLPTRTDLNLIPAQVAEDVNGRPVYGALVQQAELVVPQPGTNRRFSSYDEIAALRTDGRARYWGVTAGGELDATSGLSILARYTYSHATDDWFGGRLGGWITPGPGALPGTDDWTDGTSDFDAPHRAVVALVFDAPLGVALTGIYRFESGRPFTPGFQQGVDINGDGYAGNDPAFVDPSIPGTSDLVSEWSCLQAGSFSERNSCRAANTHTVDARLRIPIRRGSGLAASVMVDALNVLDTRADIPDAALYVVDPDGTLVNVDGTITVPLLANPHFGKGRAGAASRRVLRLGFSLEW